MITVKVWVSSIEYCFSSRSNTQYLILEPRGMTPQKTLMALFDRQSVQANAKAKVTLAQPAGFQPERPRKKVADRRIGE